VKSVLKLMEPQTVGYATCGLTGYRTRRWHSNLCWKLTYFV